MAILVTGGAGFIGSHLLDRLLTSCQESLVCLDSFNNYYDPALKRANIAHLTNNPRVVIIEGDLCDISANERLFATHDVSRVVHLGAYAGVRPSIAQPLLYEHNNVRGTLALLEAARKHPVQRFVMASSSTVYGSGAASPFVEDAPLGVPLSPYGATKRSAELFAQTYHQLHQVPIVCVRPFSVYGPRLRPDLAVAIFAKKIAAGEPLSLFGDGTMRRDFTYIDDICAGLLAALERPAAIGAIINLGHHKPIAMSEVIDTLAAAIGRPAIIDFQPEQAGDMALTYADLTKARSLLDYHPTVPFADGVKDYILWLRSTGQIPAH